MDRVALATTLRITATGDAPGTTTLVVSGEVDCASASLLRKRIGDALSAGTTTLIVDLARVSFLDASGLGVLIGGLRRARECGGDLIVLGASRPVSRVLEVTGLSSLLIPLAAPEPGRSGSSPVREPVGRSWQPRGATSATSHRGVSAGAGPPRPA